MIGYLAKFGSFMSKAQTDFSVSTVSY